MQGAAAEAVRRAGVLDVRVLSASVRGGVLTLSLDLASLLEGLPAIGKADVPRHVASACAASLDAAAAVLEVSPESLQSPVRAAPWCLGRQLAMYWTYEHKVAPYTVLARWFEVDRGTVKFASESIRMRRLQEVRVHNFVAKMDAILLARS